MRVVSLASGSGGNAYLVESAEGSLLIDCGICCSEIVKRCRPAGLDPSRIAAVLLTHNHIDHVRGLAAFHRRYPGALLFANMMTADAISAVTGVGAEDFCIFENGQSFGAGPFEASAFSIPHDVPDPVGYVVKACDGTTYFHATDVGTPLDSVGIHIAAADIATIESNHDPVMLSASARPESLKRRIRGPRGHLSNDDAAELVARFASPRLKRLALAHLSRECNVPHLAEGAMRAALAERSLSGTRLTVLSQETAVEI